MKKIISFCLIVSLFSFSAFADSKDKYEKIADKVYETVSPEHAALEEDDNDLTTGEKAAIGAAAVAGAAALIYGGVKLYNYLNKDKYENIADKAYEATK